MYTDIINPLIWCTEKDIIFSPKTHEHIQISTIQKFQGKTETLLQTRIDKGKITNALGILDMNQNITWIIGCFKKWMLVFKNGLK